MTETAKPAGCDPCSWPDCGCQYSPNSIVEPKSEAELDAVLNSEDTRPCIVLPDGKVTYQTDTREVVAQALLDRFIERGQARLGGPTYPPGTKMKSLPPSYSDDLYRDADAVLKVLAAPPQGARK